MAKQKQDDQLEHTYNSYVRIRDVAQKTCQRRWITGRSGESGSGISVLAARHDDDDDIYIYIRCIHIAVSTQPVLKKTEFLFIDQVWFLMTDSLSIAVHFHMADSLTIADHVTKKDMDSYR